MVKSRGMEGMETNNTFQTEKKKCQEASDVDEHRIVLMEKHDGCTLDIMCLADSHSEYISMQKCMISDLICS